MKVFPQPILWFFFFLCFGLCVCGNPTLLAQEKLSMALFPFIDKNGEEPYWGYLFRDLVKRDLSSLENVDIIDPFSADNLVRNSRIAWGDLTTSMVAQTLGKRLESDYVLVGSLRHRTVAGQRRIIVTARLHRLKEGDYIDIPSEIFAETEMIQAGRYIAQEVAQVLGFSLFPAPSFSFSLSTLVPLYQGVVKADEAIRTYKENQYPDRPLWKEAFTLAERTMREEPEYSESYYYLANMYRETKWWAKEAEMWDFYVEKLDHGENTVPAQYIAEVYLRLAHAYFNQKRLDLASLYLEKAIKIDTQFVEAYLLLGRIYYEQDHMEKAEEVYTKAYTLAPHSKEARYFLELTEKARLFGKSAYEAYMRGYQYFNQGNFLQAEASLQEAVHLNPNFKEAYYWLGRTLYELGKLSEAEEVWEKVLAIDPFHSQARRFLDRTQQEIKYGREAVRSFQEGYEHYEKGNYEAAIAGFRQATMQSPSFQDAHEYLARCYYRLGRTEEYLREREKVVELLSRTQDRAWYAYNIGYELFTWGKKEEAEKILKRAITENPSLGEAHLLLGDIYGERGEWSLALTHYAEARKHVGEEAQAQAIWGMVTAFYQLQRFEELLPLVEELIVHYPYAEFIEEAEVIWIETLVRKKEYRRAQLAFRQFQLRFPRSAFLEKATFFYTLSFYEEKKWREALPLLENFVKLYPQSLFLPQATEMLGYVYRNLGKTEEARQIFSQNEGEEGSFLVADTWYKEKNWENAIAGFTRYLDTYPQGKFFLEARLKLASSYLEKGRLEEAQKAINGVEDQIMDAFPVDFLRLSIKLRFAKEEWQETVNDVLLLEKKVGSLEEYLLVMAFAYYRLGQIDNAQEALLRAGKNPQEVLAAEEKEVVKRALEAMERGDYPSVITELEKVKGMSEENRVLIAFLLGKAHYFLNHFEESYHYLAPLIHNENFAKEVRFYLIDLAYREKNWSKIVELYQGLGEETQDTNLLWRVAVAYHGLGELEKSRELLETVCDEGGELGERATLLLLEELYTLKDYPSFLERAEKFLNEYPHHPHREELLYLVAWVHYLVGNMAQSGETIMVYRSEFPQGTHIEELLSLLADIKMSEGSEEARSLLEELDSRGTLNLDLRLYTWYRLGSVYLRQEEFHSAKDYFGKIIEQGQNAYFDRASYYLGVCLEYLDRFDEAIEAYKFLVEKGQDPMWKDKAKERLRLLTQE